MRASLGERDCQPHAPSTPAGPAAPVRHFRMQPFGCELVAAVRAAQAERKLHAGNYAHERIRAMDAADVHIRQAERRHAAAVRSMETGAEPLPGERIGTVRPGFSQFSEAYWIRLTELEREVAQTTKALEEAYAGRNALRD